MIDRIKAWLGTPGQSKGDDDARRERELGRTPRPPLSSPPDRPRLHVICGADYETLCLKR